jgi:ABC-type sulfate transport system permease component
VSGTPAALGRSRARTVLTVAEVALAVILMIGAGLLIRSFVGVRNVDVGFDPQNLATAILSAPPTVPTLLIGIVLTASYLSARAAARVNPSSALRGE